MTKFEKAKAVELLNRLINETPTPVRHNPMILQRQVNLLRKNGIYNSRKLAVSPNGKLLLTAYSALEMLERRLTTKKLRDIKFAEYLENRNCFERKLKLNV